jgi:maltose alpha-D-glucosyltransferase / alpha-amylase
MLTLPGTPVINYGEEIGMGDDLSLSERESVRTPMQWTADRNAGFSAAPPDKLISPVVNRGRFAYRKVNVEDQRRDDESLLNWLERAIRRRKETPELGWGKADIVETDEPHVFAHSVEWQDGTVIAVHNLAAQGAAISLDLSEHGAGRIVDLLEQSVLEPAENRRLQLDLGPYEFHWFRVDKQK